MQALQRRGILEFLQHPGKLLLRGDNDRLAVFEKARQVVGFLGDAHHVFQMGKFLDVLTDIRIERFAVSEDKRDVYQLLTCAKLVEAVQTVCQPADG